MALLVFDGLAIPILRVLWTADVKNWYQMNAKSFLIWNKTNFVIIVFTQQVTMETTQFVIITIYQSAKVLCIE